MRINPLMSGAYRSQPEEYSDHPWQVVGLLCTNLKHFVQTISFSHRRTVTKRNSQSVHDSPTSFRGSCNFGNLHNEMLRDRLVLGFHDKGTPHEHTAWISDIVTIMKPGKLWVCIDPRDLNKAIKRPKYQMPTLEEILPTLAKAKMFTVLDPKDGFHQVKLEDAQYICGRESTTVHIYRS